MTINDLFSTYHKIIIPEFQRAYSWGRSQVEEFLLDIEESSTTEQQYYYGHYLVLREDKDGNVIDGQQRLTTLALFLAAAKHTLGIDLPLYELLLSKFHTVEYDDLFFQNLLRGKHFAKKDLPTQSAKRLLDAYQQLKIYCENETYSSRITDYIEVLATAEITLHEITSLVRATQVFTYANDRGKPLTELEKVKAFVAYQYYRLGAPEASIVAFYDRFTRIYNSIELISYRNEDQVLHACLDAYYTFFDKNKGFSDAFYEAVKLSEEQDKSVEDQLAWLDKFSQRLELAFNGLVELDKFGKSEYGKESAYQAMLILPKTQPFYAFFIRLNELDRFNADIVTDAYERLFYVFELLFLAEHAKSSRISLSTRFKNSEFFVYEDQLSSVDVFMQNHVDWIEENWLQGEDSAWHLDLLQENLCHYGQIYTQLEHPLVNYVLWQYECSLRDRRMRNIDYFDITEPSIEHIGPQSIMKNGHTPGSGYSFSQRVNPESDKFLNRLHGWGNLLLVPKSLNSGLGYSSWHDKREKIRQTSTGPSAQHPTLKQYEEVIYHKKWTSEAIQERGEKIVNFIEAKWFR
ncbi:DUF262 domain-containing HNH endonuclease family protein [Entomospira nematocerorum]|uniref:DUF262 domain-containing protein n=1 Tax=Entomospira nematocerorum TaxID=2719987 RepID=A0A968GEJ0_9SPIO|nr:DUF262 domain-containing protein [Entomospira nematocera]NIZ46316.1 DUF262 domain-containing protein [Entomospira nematocera]WDI33880.1 DUF262 domain-containing HNH endonuclease family protein [Entomospira nematocera]